MSPGAATGTLYLIDAHSLIFQVFHAIRGMSSPSGLPTNALFGFIRDILFLRGLAPDYLLCAFDRAEPTFRSALYADYKAHREAMPDDLQIQIPLIYQALEALGVPVVSVAGYEADDILATVAPQAEQRGLEVLLCTSDKDCRQLITDRVQLYSLRKRERFGRKELLDDVTWPKPLADLLEEPGLGSTRLRQTSMESRRQRYTSMSRVRESLIRHLEASLGVERHHPYTSHPWPGARRQSPGLQLRGICRT